MPDACTTDSNEEGEVLNGEIIKRELSLFKSHHLANQDIERIVRRKGALLRLLCMQYISKNLKRRRCG